MCRGVPGRGVSSSVRGPVRGRVLRGRYVPRSAGAWSIEFGIVSGAGSAACWARLPWACRLSPAWGRTNVRPAARLLPGSLPPCDRRAVFGGRGFARPDGPCVTPKGVVHAAGLLPGGKTGGTDAGRGGDGPGAGSTAGTQRARGGGRTRSGWRSGVGFFGSGAFMGPVEGGSGKPRACRTGARTGRVKYL